MAVNKLRRPLYVETVLHFADGKRVSVGGPPRRSRRVRGLRLPFPTVGTARALGTA